MGKKLTIFCVIFLFFGACFCFVFGQKTSDDEFKQLENKIYQQGLDQVKAFELSKLYLAKAKKTKEVLKISDGYALCIGYALNDVDKAKYADSLITFNTRTKDDRLIGFAYRGASMSYFNLNDYNKALDYALISYEYSKHEERKQYAKNSESLIARIKFVLEDYEGAKEMFQEIVDYYEWKHVANPSTPNRSLYIVNTLRLIKTNASLKDFASNTALFAKLDKVFKEHQDIQEHRPYYQSALGFQRFMQGKYDAAIQQFNKALSLYKDKKKHLYEKFYIGRSYEKLGEQEQAMPYFNEILQDYEERGRISMEYRPMFEFYIDYYKNKGKRDEQLNAVDRLLDYDRTFALEQKDIARKIKVDYDNQRLLNEKSKIESDQKKERWAFIAMITLLAFSLILWLMYRRQKRKEKLIQNIEIISEDEEKTNDIEDEEIVSLTEAEVVSQENETEEIKLETGNGDSTPESTGETEMEAVTDEIESTAIQVDDDEEKEIVNAEAEEDEDDVEIIQPRQEVPKENDYSEYLPINKDTAIQILKKLEQFEKRKKFLKKNIRLTSLATEMNTNDKYLSRVIKVKTGKIFHEYLKDLRFDYLNDLLENDPEIRNKPIKEISKKLGYSSPEFFTAHFKERYGVAPTEYFKEDDEINETSVHSEA